MGRSNAAPLQGQERAGEFAFLRLRFHYAGNDCDFHSECGDRGGLGFVGGIDDEDAGEVGVELGDAERGWFVAELGEHFVGGAF